MYALPVHCFQYERGHVLIFVQKKKLEPEIVNYHFFINKCRQVLYAHTLVKPLFFYLLPALCFISRND